MKFLRELLFETSESKKLAKAAVAVYHRDYEKTKNRVYRQYDPVAYAKKRDKKRRRKQK